MKTLLKYLTPILMLLLMPGLLQAQDDFRNASPEERAEMQTEWMTELLELDEDTAEEVHAINLKYAKEIERVIAADERRFKRMREMKAIRSAKTAEFKKVLTKEQFLTLQQKRAELRERMKEEGRKHRSGKGRGNNAKR